jgi:hypothetical protein
MLQAAASVTATIAGQGPWVSPALAGRERAGSGGGADAGRNADMAASGNGCDRPLADRNATVPQAA